MYLRYSNDKVRVPYIYINKPEGIGRIDRYLNAKIQGGNRVNQIQSVLMLNHMMGYWCIRTLQRKDWFQMFTFSDNWKRHHDDNWKRHHDIYTELALEGLKYVLAPCSTFKRMIFKLIIQNNSLGTRWGIAVMWMPQNLTNEKSALVQVTNNYRSQCRPKSMASTKT